MGTVTISAVTYTVYGDATGLSEYAGGSFTWSATYTAASVTQRAQALVEATRLLDRQRWDGDKTSSAQALAWPRDSVTATPASGVAVTDGVTPDEIVTGAYELALAMLAKPAVVAGGATGSTVQTATAGNASVTFFSPTLGGRFPDRVMELVGWAYGSTSSDLPAARELPRSSVVQVRANAGHEPTSSHCSGMGMATTRMSGS